MTKSEIYLEAAKLVDSGAITFSCVAIDEAAGQGFSLERYEYDFLFRPEGGGNCWGRHFGDGEDRKNCRVLALLFMSQIAKE